MYIMKCFIISQLKGASIPFFSKMLIKVLFPTQIDELRHLICA